MYYAYKVRAIVADKQIIYETQMQTRLRQPSTVVRQPMTQSNAPVTGSQPAAAPKPAAQHRGKPSAPTLDDTEQHLLSPDVTSLYLFWLKRIIIPRNTNSRL